MTQLSGHGRRIKWRLLVTYAAGPLVTLALFCAATIQDGGSRRLDWSSPAPLPLWTSMVFVNGYLLVTGLIPFPRADPTIPRNDFLQIFLLPFMSQARIASLGVAEHSIEIGRLAALGNYEAAAQEARRVLRADPEDWIARTGLADLLVLAGAYGEATRHYSLLFEEGAVPAGALPRETRARLANNYAWALFMARGAGALERADRMSAEAMGSLPRVAWVRGTRGAILVDQGSIAEGEALIGYAYKHSSDRFARAANLACLAIAAARRGKRDEAQRFLARARRLDGECDLLARVESAIAGTFGPGDVGMAGK